MPRLRIITGRQALGVARGDVREFAPNIAAQLIELGLAEEVAESKPKSRGAAKRENADKK
jgi:hypothetical protein